MKKLLSIMEQLRDPDTGCPWDRKQTLKSIFPHTLEEVHEVGDAIDRADMDELKDELGDLLFQVVFYSQIAAENGDFDFNDVVAGISDKMTRRHPHVFGQASYANEAEQKADWEAIKLAERKAKMSSTSSMSSSGQEDYFKDITKGLTALQYGQKVLVKAGENGFDWANWRPIIDKVYEEVDEIIEAVENNEPQYRIEEEVGDLFIVVANLARHLKVDSENAARKATNKFARRYNQMMQMVKDRYPDTDQYTLEQMSQGWELVKKAESNQYEKHL